MRTDQRRQFAHELGVPTDRQVRVDATLDRREALVLERGHDVAGEALIAEVGQRLTAPDGQRLA